MRSQQEITLLNNPTTHPPTHPDQAHRRRIVGGIEFMENCDVTRIELALGQHGHDALLCSGVRRSARQRHCDVGHVVAAAKRIEIEDEASLIVIKQIQKKTHHVNLALRTSKADEVFHIYVKANQS